MRCQTFIPRIWTNRRRILHPWFNKSLLIFFYFVVILLDFSGNVQCNSQVCHVGSRADANCTCSNNHTEGVRCLIHELTDCQEMASKSYRLFCEVMSQFDCSIEYSVKWNCTDCLVSWPVFLSHKPSIGFHLASINMEFDPSFLSCHCCENQTGSQMGESLGNRVRIVFLNCTFKFTA